jgi:XTP/dITP diphosphohydrolase
MELLLATRNQHKAREFRELLGADFGVIDLTATPEITMPDETGKTFAENAILKATSLSKRVDGLVVADDSGLEVDALDAAPGIYSARYSGENANDRANLDKLLRELKNVPSRSARFRCVIVLAQEGKVLDAFEGVVEGTVVNSPRGSAGFGYDPVFQPTGFNQTFAEMPPHLKNKISHRAKAVTMLREALADRKDQRGG